MMKTRGENALYELFILGELKEEPMHGYLLHRIWSSMIGPLRQVSWGTLYSVLRKMETDGYIRQVIKDSDTQGRVKKLYELTVEGDAHFERLMRQPFEHNCDVEDIFKVKLSNFHHIEKDMQLEILRQYRTVLEVLLGAIEVNEQSVRNNSGIPANELPDIQSVIDYERSVHETKLTWVEAKITQMSEENT
ncbi:PadR family transcriptional regulator [Alicyclobacillus fodiniaquatilis]|uniref:PadR family transcriptional regulator n=1 Tax=Alicyclobacillus fodiniaquatilis TaxID=1661150 RepID=A0ABW4JGD2_9BACL